MADGGAEVAEEDGLAGVLGLRELVLQVLQAAEGRQHVQRLLPALQRLLIHCRHLHVPYTKAFKFQCM